MPNVYFNAKSSNAKTGKMPVSTTASSTCPPSCPFINAGCYAKSGPLARLWKAIDDAAGKGPTPWGRNGSLAVTDWQGLCDSVRDLDDGAIWRHNQAGDLPGSGDAIDVERMRQLVRANKGKRGFTYTHKPVQGRSVNAKANRAAISEANRQGFTVNISANGLGEVDAAVDLDIGPVVTVLPASVHGPEHIETPKGRRVIVCPATYREDVTCKSCQLCQRQRETVVGFPAHGTSKRKASDIASRV